MRDLEKVREEELLFGFVVTSCVVIIKSDPKKETNLHKDLRLTLEAVHRAGREMSEEMKDYLLEQCQDIRPYSMSVSFYTDPESGSDRVTVFFNDRYPIYDEEVNNFTWFNSTTGDILCQDCAGRLTEVRGGLGDLTHELYSRHSRTVIHIKSSPVDGLPHTTSLVGNIARALQMVEQFLHLDLAKWVTKPLRQVTFTLWQGSRIFYPFSHGKLSLYDQFKEDNTGGRLDYQDWLNDTLLVMCPHCDWCTSLASY